jgi:PAS domain S-box-containing protein
VISQAGPICLLLVDDEPLVGTLHKLILERNGFKVDYVLNGESALERIQQQEYQLVLMDIDLGDGMNGIETAREIIIQKDIPLLFLSSHTEECIIQETETISSYGYVVKGTGDTVLMASVKMALRLHQARILIQEKEIQFRNLFTCNPQPMWIYDMDTFQFLEVNQMAVKFYGYQQDEFLAMNLFDIRPETEHSRLRENLITSNPTEANISGVWLHKTKTGEIFQVNIISQAINWSGKEARFVTVIPNFRS